MRLPIEAKLRVEMAVLRADLIKWMFLFWLGTIAVSIANGFSRPSAAGDRQSLDNHAPASLPPGLSFDSDWTIAGPQVPFASLVGYGQHVSTLRFGLRQHPAMDGRADHHEHVDRDIGTRNVTPSRAGRHRPFRRRRRC